MVSKLATIEARVDAQMQKALQRLASAIEFRKLYGAPAPAALLEHKGPTITVVAKDVTEAQMAKDVSAKPESKEVTDRFGPWKGDPSRVTLKKKRRPINSDNENDEDW
jgi:hypothetical protein